MALSISEAWESGSGELGKESSDTYVAYVTGSITADNADNPVTVTQYAITKFSWVSSLGNILNTFHRERVAPGVWKFVATYKSYTLDRQTNDASFSFNTGGGTQHITASRATVGKFGIIGPVANPPPDFKGAIGVGPDLNIAGVDIEVEAFDFKLTFYLPAGTPATLTFMQQLKPLSKRVNSDTVTVTVDGVQMTFAPGELRFVNAEGQKRIGYADWELTLNFSSISNQNNFNIGPVFGISKRGWDYLWVMYGPTPDAAAKALVQQPVAVYVEQVYDMQPLSGLILPGVFGQSNTQPWGNPALVPGGGVS